MDILQLLEGVQSGTITVAEAEKAIKYKPYDDTLTYATIDTHRELRSGRPEVIYCEGKSLQHLEGIVARMKEENTPNLLATRASETMAQTIRNIYPEAVYHPEARLVTVNNAPFAKNKGTILVITAGTSDIAVAEEAAVTATFLGNTVERLYDVGVAGLHRLLFQLDKLHNAQVIVVVAGMEGALASVVGGLTDKPVVAVPTSVGYGASFGGVSALLSMLNTCASGVGVVNIDNGFGAGYLAHTMNALGGKL